MNGEVRGFLFVNVRYANGAAPVVEANVTLKDSNSVILGEYKAGLDGKTELIGLGTAESYMLTVSADGFLDMEKTGIPIMQNITTIQNINMFPIYNYPVEAEL